MKINTRDNDPGQYPLSLSENDWKSRLNPIQYYVLRESGTERSFTGNYVNNKEEGLYFSAASGQPLFYSDSKFDSGCGWPSFFAPVLPGAVYYRTDKSHGMIRTEIIDSASGSHLGHVFNDGPPPSFLRYCLNGAALLFVKKGDAWPEPVRHYMKNLASEQEKQLVERLMRED